MDPTLSTDNLTCRLEHPDGSVWRVTALDELPQLWISLMGSWKRVGRG